MTGFVSSSSLCPPPSQTMIFTELPHWWSYSKWVWSRCSVRLFYQKLKLHLFLAASIFLNYTIHLLTCTWTWTAQTVLLSGGVSHLCRADFLFRLVAASAISQKASENKRRAGRASDDFSLWGRRVRELLLGNRFLDDRSSPLLSDQSNYFCGELETVTGLQRKK